MPPLARLLFPMALTSALIPAAFARELAITHATVLTAAGPAQSGATVIIHDGLIASVGFDLVIPAGTR